ncbi:MAG: class I SAM-dependent methyltransferase [Microthrixaceae bacterium]
MTGTGYIHGFSNEESQRLWDQASILAPMVFAGLPLPLHGSLLEIGCGVGAELDQIAQRCPELQLTGIDLSWENLDASQSFLSRSAASSAQVAQATATQLPFADHSFDAAITIWMLEHVPDPVAVLSEAVRVLRPGGVLLCTEVDNATFGFVPELPSIALWWDMFCAQQTAGGGNPFVGRQLKFIAEDIGCEDIITEDLAIASSDMDAGRRIELLNYLEVLLLSGAAALQEAAHAMEKLRAEFNTARADPTIGFDYHAVRLSCRTQRI